MSSEDNQTTLEQSVVDAHHVCVGNDEPSWPRRDGFVNLIAIINDTRKALKDGEKTNERPSYEGSGSEGEGSSGEEGDVPEQQQTESAQDLQKELTRLEISEEATTLETLIIIVEYYAKTGDRDGFVKNIRRPDLWLLTAPRPKISDLIAMAENLQKQGLYFRAVMIHKALCALYKYEYVHHPKAEDPPDSITPNQAIIGIEDCMKKVFGIFNDILDEEDCKRYLPHFVAILYDMLTNLREIRHVNRKCRANLEAWGMLYIAVVHGLLEEDAEMKDVSDSIVSTMERRFKKKARNQVVLGTAMLALAVFHRVESNFNEMTKFAGTAVVVLQESEGMIWDDKVKSVAQVEKFIALLKK